MPCSPNHSFNHSLAALKGTGAGPDGLAPRPAGSRKLQALRAPAPGTTPGLTHKLVRKLVRERRGFALETVLLILVMFSVIVLAGLSAVTTISRTSNADYRGARASYASEGGADDIMSQLDAAMQDGVISAQDIASITTPQIDGYELTQNTRTTGAATTRTITSGPFSGLYSLNQPIDIEVSARDSSGNRAMSVLSVNAQTIPLFQFGVFYEEDLEIIPGEPMTFAGWVHSNGNIYLSSNNETFQSNITTPDSVFWQRKDSNSRLNGVYINNDAGTAVKLDFDSRSLSGPAFKTRSELKFNSRLMTSAHGVRPLKLPLPNGVAPVTLVDPKKGSDDAMVQNVKMAWKSDWYITINASNLQGATDANFCSSMMTQVRTGGLQLPDAATCKKIFKARPNVFYDRREKIKVDLVDINLDSLRIWSDANPGSRAPGVIYLEFTNTNTNTGNDYVAVRVRGGAKLPKARVSADTGGLTLATDRPLYVLGDYNVNVWRPAALMGDAITFLSKPASTCSSSSSGSGWCDLRQQTSSNKYKALTTTVNAAVLAGHSPTNCDWQRAGCGSPKYGGGLENFPRFLEDWGGIVFRYTGSLVSLFTNRQSAGQWECCNYYNPPNRQWAFDVNFRFPERLPPGTPSVGTVLQTAFRPLY